MSPSKERSSRQAISVFAMKMAFSSYSFSAIAGISSTVGKGLIVLQFLSVDLCVQSVLCKLHVFRCLRGHLILLRPNYLLVDCTSTSHSSVGSPVGKVVVWEHLKLALSLAAILVGNTSNLHYPSQQSFAHNCESPLLDSAPSMGTLTKRYACGPSHHTCTPLHCSL